jgi:hypothetical protein
MFTRSGVRAGPTTSHRLGSSPILKVMKIRPSEVIVCNIYLERSAAVDRVKLD